MFRSSAVLAIALAACGQSAPSVPAAQTPAPSATAPASPAATTAPPIALALPIACTPGRDCFVQNYVDTDPGPGRRDYRCTAQTYDGHDGVDIRLPTLAAQRAGVAVLASAPGTVRGVRDGVADVSIRQTGRGAVEGRECGNGVAVVHPNGWETQYCHMAQGSIRVRQGQSVAAGEPLGTVGLSGFTESPHVHLSVRQNGRAVDPFAYGAQPGSCGGGVNLFDARARAALAYRPGELIALGFAGGPLTQAEIDEGAPVPTSRAAPLVLYSHVINVQAGDVQTLTIAAPDGRTLLTRTLEPVPRDQANRFAFAGERPPGGSWPSGVYRGRYTLVRDGRSVIDRTVELRL